MFGKLLGAMIGAGVGLLAQSVVAAAVLAAVGAIAGHLYDALHEAPDLWEGHAGDAGRPPRPARAAPPPVSEEDRAAIEARDRYARKLCTLFVELARVDGAVVREEVRVMREYFQEDLGLEGRALNQVRNYLKAAIASAAELDDAARAVRDATQPSARAVLLDTLYALALVDGELKRSERDALRRVAQALGVSEEDHRQVTARHFGTGEAHYAALGVTPAASDEEIRSAFRRLAAQHHPDKAAHLGPKAAEAASRRFQAIKDAYEELRRLRGF